MKRFPRIKRRLQDKIRETQASRSLHFPALEQGRDLGVCSRKESAAQMETVYPRGQLRVFLRNTGAPLVFLVN